MSAWAHYAPNDWECQGGGRDEAPPVVGGAWVVGGRVPIGRLTCPMIGRMMRPMAATDTYPLVDRLIPGGLPSWLIAARDEGDSFEAIARRLATDHDITVSTETVRKWVARATEQVAS